MKARPTRRRSASPSADAAARGYFAAVTIRLGSLRPESVLATPPAGVRGFWQSGAHWIAHAGAVAEIDARDRPAADPAAGAGLFAWVEREATRRFEARWVLDLDGEGRRPRFHGGFAFAPGEGDSRSDPSGFWRPFPAARFVLPAYEVESDGAGARLTVTRWFPDDEPADAAVDELRRRADRTRERLLQLERNGAAPGPVPAATSIDAPVGGEAWRRGIERILREIDGGRVTKVVLARPLDVTLAEAADSASVLAALRASNPLAHTYLIEPATGEFLLGAAPELIGRLAGPSFYTMAVGGSIPRGADPEADAWLGRQLRGSRKNLDEHRIVVEDVVERLRGLAASVSDPPAPELLRLPRIQHLRTELSAEVDAEMHILRLVEALHPTAAVCGRPRDEAHRILREEEPVGRGWYAGPVGWFDAQGDGEFAPALRSAVARGPLLRLYAGAGIVTGSRPRSEWDETRVKLQTMLQALGVARVP